MPKNVTNGAQNKLSCPTNYYMPSSALAVTILVEAFEKRWRFHHMTKSQRDKVYWQRIL